MVIKSICMTTEENENQNSTNEDQDHLMEEVAEIPEVHHHEEADHQDIKFNIKKLFKFSTDNYVNSITTK